MTDNATADLTALLLAQGRAILKNLKDMPKTTVDLWNSATDDLIKTLEMNTENVDKKYEELKWVCMIDGAEGYTVHDTHAEAVLAFDGKPGQLGQIDPQDSPGDWVQGPEILQRMAYHLHLTEETPETLNALEGLFLDDRAMDELEGVVGMWLQTKGITLTVQTPYNLQPFNQPDV